MANRNFANSRMYTGHVMPVLLDGSAVIGSSGAVGTVKGPYIKSVTHLATGLYQIQMQDNYNRYLGGYSGFVSPASGSAIDPASGTVGLPYIIISVGNSDWTTAGVPAGVTPAPGVGFVLAAAPASGTGTVKAVISSGIASVEVIGDSNLTSAPMGPNTVGALGAIILLACYNGSGALTDPAPGSVLGFASEMSNSSILIQGE